LHLALALGLNFNCLVNYVLKKYFLLKQNVIIMSFKHVNSHWNINTQEQECSTSSESDFKKFMFLNTALVLKLDPFSPKPKNMSLILQVCI